MTALSPDATAMANLLVVLTQPDTEAIRQAEAALKPILKDPRSVPALVEILKAKDSQVSAILQRNEDLKLDFALIPFLSYVCCCSLAARTSAPCRRHSFAKASTRPLFKV
jgi:hypothetical protein